MEIVSIILEITVGFSNGVAEFAPKNPPPFVPRCLIASSAATAPVLILVGLMMMSSVKKVDFLDYSEAIPAFICIIFMPLAYSISDGIVLGLAQQWDNIIDKDNRGTRKDGLSAFASPALLSS